MNTLAFHILAMLVSAGPVTPTNPVLNDLVTKGITMPDGQVVKLPEPLMPDGLTAAQQTAVLEKAASKGGLAAFLASRSNADVSLKQAKAQCKDGLIRTVNAAFVVHGSWDVLTSEEFSKTILKKDASNGPKQGTTVSKADYLKPAELLVRRLTARSTPELKEYFLYTTFQLFNRVEISATRFGVATKTPTGVVVAATVDPRFAADKEYPNQWRPITRNALGQPVLGPPQPYLGAGFYAKVTRLAQPADGVFVEYHSAFYEPERWFGADDVNLMPSQLKNIIPYQVKQFRIKLALATKDAEEKKSSGGEKKATETTASR